METAPRKFHWRKGKTKSKESYSRFRIFPRFKCLKLKSTEIKYDGSNVGELVNFLVSVSGSALKNVITLTRTEDVTDDEDVTDNEDGELADLPEWM